MNNFLIGTILNLFLLVPAVVAIYRFRLIDKTFLPFLLLIWVGAVNEILSLVLIYTVKTNSANSNIYVLLEYILVMYQFYRWSDRSAKLYLFFILAGLLVWITDNLLLNSIFYRNALFRIFYSFIVIFFSIDQVNKLIVYERRSLFKNPVFLVCLTFLIYYSCKAFVEVFITFDLGLDEAFNEKVIMLMVFSNFFSNILYTIALVCIPPKLEFTLPY